MIKFICGREGSGKTQKLIDAANGEAEKDSGTAVYIDKSDKRRLTVDSRVKFINTSELELSGPDGFMGLLSGILCANYDVSKVFIDNVLEITGLDEEGFVARCASYGRLSERFAACFVFTMSTEHEELYVSAC